MNRITLTLQLEEPVIISASNATAGLFETLDYIPGSTLLGAIASFLYRPAKDQDRHRQMFHDGTVRFGNLTPEGAPPAPLCLHHPKADKTTLYNWLYPQPDSEGLQLKQLRKGYLAQTRLITPSTRLHLRTAVNPDTGTASEGQLYAYQAISPDHRWVGYIDCDDAQLAQMLMTHLKKKGHLLIGRSRSAHYGRARIESVEMEEVTAADLPVLTLDGKDYLVLWLTSDLAAFDHMTGQPTLAPRLKDLHPDLPDVELDKDKSFVRTREYAPYNAYRKSYDPSRQVITQGSVLAYPLEGVASLPTQLGAYTTQGLGRYAAKAQVEALLGSARLVMEKARQDQPKASAPQPAQTLQLIRWLTDRYKQQNCKELIEAVVNDAVTRLKALYGQAARQTLSPPFGPTRTQWNRIREVAENYRNENDLTALFQHLEETGQPWHTEEHNPNTQDRTGSVQDGWQVPVGFNTRFVERARDIIQTAFNKIEEDTACRKAGLFLRTLAHKMATDKDTQKLSETGKS